MHGHRKNKIVRMYRDGFHGRAIARECNTTCTEVAWILFKRGVITINQARSVEQGWRPGACPAKASQDQ